MKISCIYIIKSKSNINKIYIGSAADFLKRKRMHIYSLKIEKHVNTKIQNHFNKYGIEDFSFEILERIYDKSLLLIKEQYYMDLYRPFFNICKIAGSPMGLKRSDATKLKLSELKKGNRNNLGHKQSNEHKDNISKSNRNKKRTLDQRILMGAAHKGIGKGLNNLQYIKDNISNKSQQKIAVELGIHQSTISKILKKCA